jgi:hypothetical protein
MTTVCKTVAGLVMAIATIVAALNVLDFLHFSGRTVDGAAALAASSGSNVAQALIVLLLAMIVYLLTDSKTLFPKEAEAHDTLAAAKQKLQARIAEQKTAGPSTSLGVTERG